MGWHEACWTEASRWASAFCLCPEKGFAKWWRVQLYKVPVHSSILDTTGAKALAATSIGIQNETCNPIGCSFFSFLLFSQVTSATSVMRRWMMTCTTIWRASAWSRMWMLLPWAPEEHVESSFVAFRDSLQHFANSEWQDPVCNSDSMWGSSFSVGEICDWIFGMSIVTCFSSSCTGNVKTGLAWTWEISRLLDQQDWRRWLGREERMGSGEVFFQVDRRKFISYIVT